MDFFNEFMTSLLTALGGGLAAMLLTIPKRRKQEQKELKERQAETDKRFDKLEAGIRAVLKDKIQKEYLSICSDRRKYAKPYEKENVSNLFQAYTSLGGNGYIAKLYDHIMAKPVQKDDDNLK